MRKLRALTTLGSTAFAGLLLAAPLFAPPLAQVRASARSRDAAPALKGKQWINIAAADIANVTKFEGRVTVLHFWTFECINCRHNLPAYAKWASKYKPSDVQVIGVHTPELPAERVPANVRKAVKALGIHYPVLIDGDGVNWTNYHQEFWPTVYVIDKKGDVRYRWVGELGFNGQNGFAEVTKVIERLRKE
ncbi:MAG: redoxin domain-containing protein [Fimbriimonadaceae bacterium]